jgi:two-component system LytT family sensor kinase
MSPRVRYWLLQTIGWGTYSAVGVAFTAEAIGWSDGLVTGYMLFFCYSIALTEAFRHVMMGRRWLELSSWRLWLRLAAAVPLIVAIQVFLVVSISLLLMPGGNRWSLGAVLGLTLSMTLVTGTWTTLYIRLTEKRRMKAREVALQLTLREAELGALQQQVNPHFLFNCLNSIRALVIEDPRRAQEMVTCLANMLRYSFGRQFRDTVPLSAELKIVNDYLALETVRFEERLRVHIDVDPAVRHAEVPPMLLPTLVENAVKHGIAATSSGGEISIRAVRDGPALHIEVANSGGLGEPRPEAVGLANLRERLRLLYGDRAGFTLRAEAPNRVVARVTVPLSVRETVEPAAVHVP